MHSHADTAGAGRRGRLLPRWRGETVKPRYIVLLLLMVLAFLFRHPLAVNGKVALLIAQEFPQVPVKPLSLLTNNPAHSRLTLPSPYGPVVADLFLPRPRFGGIQPHSTPAVILAFGVKVPRSARRAILSLARTLSRLGYVVMWPRLRVLDEGQRRVEEPGTFVEAFQYLERVKAVDRERISYFGISVGASIALVAASDPRIARRIRAVISFGGYFNIFDYFESLATGLDRFQGHEIAWRPSADAVNQVKAILRHARAWSMLRLFGARSVAQANRLLRMANPGQVAGLRRFDPADHLSGLRARIFILHDRNDNYVPYVESEKLARALPRRIQETLLITTLFQHVDPGKSGLGPFLGGVASLYGFVYQGVDYL